MSTVEAAPSARRRGDERDRLQETWRERLEHARRHRRSYEPAWMSSLAFAAGKHWLQWNTQARRLELPADMQGRDLFVADRITEYRTAVLGEMGQDDERPELLLIQDDEWAEQFAEQLNRAVGYAWDHEWQSDTALEQARRYCVDLGTSAVRCRFDPHAGPPRQTEVPFQEGSPILDPERARGYVAEQAANGGRADLRQISEGRTRWEPLSAFNLLVPPGVPHEYSFPWEAVVRPVAVADVRDMWGVTLPEDGDVGSLFGFDESSAETHGPPDAASGNLKEHVWLYTVYQRPGRRLPKGRVLQLAGREMQLVHVSDELPYQAPDETWRSGIAYLHWWRVSGRFWSRGLVEALKDPQRILNRRKTQNVEIIDRGMPFVAVEEKALKQTPRGLPMEIVRIAEGKQPPTLVSGLGPGPWMYQDMESLAQDMEHATGVRAVRLGENPTSVQTYSQLALINENDSVKREQIYREHAQTVARLIEDSVWDMREHWGPDKQITLADEDERSLTAHVFNATKIPSFFLVKVAKGTAKPRSQAANLKLVEDIWRASLESQQPLPLAWLKDSYQAGQPLDLPDVAASAHADKAELENHMIEDGQQVEVAYYDPPEVHVPQHREAQIQAELAGEQQLMLALEDHIQQHLQVAAMVALQQAQAGGGTLPEQPGGPPQPTPEPSDAQPQTAAPQPQ